MAKPMDDFEDFEEVTGDDFEEVSAGDDFEEVSAGDDFEEVSAGGPDDFEDVTGNAVPSGEDFEDVSGEDFEDVSGDDFEEVSAGADDFETVEAPVSGGSDWNTAAGRYLENSTYAGSADEPEEPIAGNPVAESVRAKALMPPETAAERKARRKAEDKARRAEEKARRRADAYADEQPDGEETAPGKRRGGKGILTAILLILLAAGGTAGFYFYRQWSTYQSQVAYYEDHFLPYTTLNGTDISGLTAEEVGARLEEQLNSYSLTLKTRDGEAVLTAADADMKPDLEGLKEALQQQDPKTFNRTSEEGSKVQLKSAISLDTKMLRKSLKALPVFQNMTESRNAAVVFDEAAGQYVLQEAVQGNKVSLKTLAKKLAPVLRKMGKSYDLVKRNYYTAVTEATDAMRQEVEAKNQYLRADVQLDFGDAGVEVLPKSVIASCLTFTPEQQVTFDSAAITGWVASLAEKYNTLGKPHSFTASNGQAVTVEGGSYGWQMDQEATAGMVTEAVTAGTALASEPVYTSRASSHLEHDYGSTYIEVDLNEQKMYLYKGGEQVLSSDIVSGKVSAGTLTPTGVFAITAKEADKVLTGPDYEITVGYWMAFQGETAFHDADWRDEFGGNIYLASGSDGCVNLPVSVAAELFGAVEVGTPVIVFGGAATYETEAPAETEAPTEAAPAEPEQQPEREPEREERETRRSEPENRENERQENEEQDTPEEEPVFEESQEETQAAPETQADTPETQAPETQADTPETQAPETQADTPETQAPETQAAAPETQAPETNAPQQDEPEEDEDIPEAEPDDEPEAEPEPEPEVNEPDVNEPDVDEMEDLDA